MVQKSHAYTIEKASNETGKSTQELEELIASGELPYVRGNNGFRILGTYLLDLMVRESEKNALSKRKKPGGRTRKDKGGKPDTR